MRADCCAGWSGRRKSVTAPFAPTEWHAKASNLPLSSNDKRASSSNQGSFMCRDAFVAIAAVLAVTVLTVEPVFAFGHGGGGHAAPGMVRVTSAVSQYSAR